MDAVKLRPKAWEPLIRHKEARILMMPMLVLGADDPDNPPFGPRPLPEDEVDELFEHGAEIIPECVMGIYAFWREHGAQPAPKDTAVLRMYHNALQLLSAAIGDKTIRISRRPSPYPRNRFTAFK